MKLLSSFDTELSHRLLKEDAERYWKDKVLLVFRDKIFLIFTVIIPIIVYLATFIWAIIIWFLLDYESFYWYSLLFIFVVSFFVVWWKILKLFIDYHMDFAVVNPKQIKNYNQTWLFSREARTLDTFKLKTVSVNKKWIIRSIFNFWALRFLSEWDNVAWDIELKFISNPDKVKNDILAILEYWRKLWHWTIDDKNTVNDDDDNA